MAKFVDAYTRGRIPEALRLDASTVVLIDEAGMTDSADIDAVITHAREAGASVRLIGDPAQLDAVTGAGSLRLFDRAVGAVHMDQIWRFHSAEEADATMCLRSGSTSAADFYIDNGRLHTGTVDSVTESMVEAWKADLSRGDTSVMIAATRDQVTTLARAAQAWRISTGAVKMTTTSLADGSVVGIGDLVVTRRNDRENTYGRGDFVRNGDTWTVTAVDKTGALTLSREGTHDQVQVDAEYAAQHVDLGYAVTVHGSQGRTVDHAHLLINDTTGRDQPVRGAHARPR
ncbi:AAA family ATPase [Demequina litorisediminis]|uniref:AAA family ATPase n=1 Tax=Demequina litorisediminis TaxID=1849022 RepID=UPI0024E0D8B4|nr:AAA family ATPase [Demequina litorisediminis]